MIETLIILAMTTTSPIPSGQQDGDYTRRDYVCQANGEFFEEGAQACLDIPGSPRPALCGTVLNNSAWKLLEGSCRPGEPVQPTEERQN